MSELKAIPLSYGMGVNQLFNSRFKRVTEIRKCIEADKINFNVIDKIKECDNDEISNVIDIVIDSIDLDMDSEKFISLISVANGINNVIVNKNCCDIDDKIQMLIDKIVKVYDNLALKGLTNETNANIMNHCLANLQTFVYKCKGIEEKAPIVEYNKIGWIRHDACNESIILSTTSEKIYSEANPNGTNIVGRNMVHKNPSDLLNDILSAEDYEELMINRIPNIKKYFDMYRFNINASDIEKIRALTVFLVNKLFANNTGLRKLHETLTDVLVMVSGGHTDDFESHDQINKLKEFIEIHLDIIEDRIYKNETDNIDYKTDIMTEFGFGFIYEYPEENMTLDEATSFINELNSISDYDIYELMAGLTEAITDFEREEKARLKMQKKEQLQREKAQKREQKEKEKEEKKEQRKRDRATIRYKGRVLTLTDATARNAVNSIKRAIGGIAVGGAVALLNPALGIITGALTIITAFCRSKATPSIHRKRCVLDLRAELKVIDHKINEMDRAGDEKNKAKLIRMREKMEETCNRLSYTMYAGDLY